MTSIVTKTGDKGSTSLYGGGRVPKHSPRIEAYGTVDELNAALGVAITSLDLPADIREQLLRVQHALFRVGGDLATPLTKKEKQERVGLEHVEVIDGWIREIEPALPLQQRFILPGGSPAAAHLHLARTICRRAERRVTALMGIEVINPAIQIYLNRLGDLLFLLARKVNVERGVGDVEVEY